MQLTKWVHEPIWISKVKVIQWPWTKVIQIQHFQTSFPEKPLGWLKSNLMDPPWDEETKVYSNSPGHMTKMAAMPIYAKILKLLLLWNQKSDDLGSWYTASGTSVLPNLFKWWRWVDLDLFYGKVKFCPLCFCMGRRLNNGFFRNYCSLWYQSW